MRDIYYDFSGTNQAEQYNTLLVVDKALQEKHLTYKPSFYILGGTALLFHDITSVVTIDIDLANQMQEDIKEIVDPLINDDASEVATLAKNYISRAIPYKPEVFKAMDVYILSIEDLVITKLGAGRHKDMEDLSKNGLLQRCNVAKLSKIMVEELPPDVYLKLLERFNSI